MSGAGISFLYSSGFLAGTTIADNWGKHCGAVAFEGLSAEGTTSLEFDPLNRCSIYGNHATHGNDIFIGADFINHIDIYLDKASVSDSSIYAAECIHTEHFGYGETFTYTLHYNTAVIDQQFADLYVSPDGDDANSGLSPLEPLKTIALAIQRIGAAEQNPQTIHLANGVYAEDQHFPLNLRSYVSIVGQSEAGVIFGGPDVFFIGFDSEKEVLIKNITFQAVTNQEFFQSSLIECCSRNTIEGVLDKFSITLENLSFRNCRPMHYYQRYMLTRLIYPERLVMRNITVEDCMGTIAFSLWGGNLYAENICIHNFYAPPYGRAGGIAFSSTTNNPASTGGDNIIHNMQITGCEANSVEGSTSSVVWIGSSFLPTTFETYLINCTIADNRWATGYGAAIVLGEDAKATFINSIISNDIGLNFYLKYNPLPSRLRFMNCLVGTADNLVDTIYSHGGFNTIEWHGSNISSDPEFYTWIEGNPYTLGQESPCIDAGTTDFSIFSIPNWYQFPACDLAGNPRIYGNQVDLGAYEWQGQTGSEDPLAAMVKSLVNFPNPFNPSTTISYYLPESTTVRLEVFNLKGQLVKNLIDTHQTAGRHDVVWDGRDMTKQLVASGVYFYRLTSPRESYTRKMLMLK